MKKPTHTPRARRARGAKAASRAASRGKRTRGDSSAIALPPECTLAGAEDLKTKLAALSRSVKRVTIEVGAVRRIDSASLQLLAAFARDRRASELPVALSGASGAFAEGARLLGLASLLGTEPAPHGAPTPHGEPA